MSEFGGIEKPANEDPPFVVSDIYASGGSSAWRPAPSSTTLHTGRDEDSGTEFLLTVFEDGLMTIATRPDVGATWSPPHVLAERTGEATS